MKKKILISAGEPSGDLHASKLVRALKTINPELTFSGIGCDKLEAEGVRLFERMDRHSIVGIWEIVANLGFIKKLFSSFENEIKSNPPDIAVLVDYPGFNIRLAKLLKKHNVPCVYFITPQVWAWGKWRIKTLKRTIKKALVILDFEEKFFASKGIDATFIGHPLLDDLIGIPDQTESKSVLKIPEKRFTITILPGSRFLEVKRILPVLIKSVKMIRKTKEAACVISRCSNLDPKLYEDTIKNAGGLDDVIFEDDLYTAISAADFVLAVSGTVTLQTAIAEKPMVITYITSFLTYWIGRMFVKPPIGLVNVIAGKMLVPEILQYDLTPKKLTDTALSIINNEETMIKIKNDLADLRTWLGEPGASERAASIINTMLD